MVDGAVSALSLSDNARTDPALQALVDSVRLERHGTRIDLAAQLAIDLAERTWDPKLDTAMREKKAEKAKPAK
jgi:hypothetical protein